MIMGAVVLRRYIEPLLGPRARPHRVDQDRHQVAGLLAAAVRHRPGRRRHAAAVRGGRGHGPEPGPHGALLPSRASWSRRWSAEAVSRIRSAGGVIRTQAPLISTINDDARHLGRDVADPAADGDGAVLHVRGARHRPAGLLRGPAGPRGRDLPRRLQQRVGPVPDRARAVHVGHARQGLRRRRGRDRGREGLRAAHDPGAGPVAGGPAVLRPVRPARRSGSPTWSQRSRPGSRSRQMPAEPPGLWAEDLLLAAD